jgi:two-component system sensor histidine kinase RegB
VTDPSLTQLLTQRRTNWVRLRTLVILRWIAIAGQIGAIEAATHLFGIDLPLTLCYLVIALAALANLLGMAFWPGNKRLTEREGAGMLLVDIVQLSALLALTGGLNNPFALLILVPVTISATALRWRTTVALGVISILLVTLVTLWHVPLRVSEGLVMLMPRDFVFGFWLAIVIGVVFLAGFAQRVTSEVHAMSDALVATQLALAREQKLTALGGVVAAAAHELGTPLATIKLVSSEMMSELEGEHREDAQLIHDQANRCRDILRSMGHAGKEDLHLRRAPLGSVLREAAEPHEQRGREIVYRLAAAAGDPDQPVIERRPEIIHGLRNLVQNAVDFAASTVRIDGSWTDDRITVRIMDDGPGFPPSILTRIGDPFVRRRRADRDRQKRPEYEGMGLGLFIAKALLERTGAELDFSNGARPSHRGRTGAVVMVAWPRREISPLAPGVREVLGENRPIEA